MDSKFWFVWNPKGHAPKHKHLTAELAVTEANRLAKLNPSHYFIVLEALSFHHCLVKGLKVKTTLCASGKSHVKDRTSPASKRRVTS